MTDMSPEIVHLQLMTKLDAVQEKVTEVKEQLIKLNGQVAKNTAHRYKQTVINVVLGSIGVAAIGAVFSIGAFVVQRVITNG